MLLKQTERALAPDLARGTMLVLVALANSTFYLYGRPYGPRQHVIEHDMLDRIVSMLNVTFVELRGYPMFAAMFAYGVVQMLRHLPVNDGKSVARRRFQWMIVFGFAHATLLFPADILGLYGVLGFILLAVMRAKDRTLLTVAAWWLVLVAIIQGFVYTDTSYSENREFFWSFEVDDPVTALLLRPMEWLLTPFGVLGVGSAALVGIWAARRGVLAEPEQHRTLLRRTAIVGVSAAVIGGLPMGLVVGRFWTPDSGAFMWALSALHSVTGVAGGLGYAALIGLFAANKRSGPGVRAISACGERSLSCYLFQSVVFVALLMPYTLGLGGVLGSAEIAFVAVGTWLASVLLADQLRRRGKRGPAEILIRRLTYRR
ncbi:DUF418 domain-containing protein [Kibdelosporangium philippinense]|uniref:DUF418 domain-containing protein n=1 Tax=Kibdelosporangium philippinense TaxID=211113 RepID=A0ABS8Z569_9PSEU|nr:DUF418 domain-containing protein [Kibdelosporangium philippinense]MCE7001781.1 DUF418 domain-containing protein [Kibdelosporangium philippinense]